MIINNMKKCSKCKNIKNLDCFYKDKSNKDGLTWWCKECINIKQKGYNSANKEKTAAYQRQYRLTHKEELAIYIAQYHIGYYEKNKEKIDKYQATYREENRELCNKRIANWDKANPGKRNSYTAKHRAAKLRATPNWLTKEQLEQIAKIYEEAARLTKETGVSHHVDHIIPLQGKSVSGLHVPWNLQVLVGPGPSGNLAKGNRLK